MRERWSTAIWSLALVAVILGFFFETVFCGHSLVPTDLLHNLMLPYASTNQPVQVRSHYAMDALAVDYPWAVFWQRAVRNGELPLWNPHILGGHPHLADTQPAVFSPFKLPYLFLSAERAFSLGIVLQFLAAGLLMFIFLRDRARSPVAAFIGGSAWALNSALLMWYWRGPGLFCWAPLVLLFGDRAITRNSWSYACAAGLTLGVAFLSGNLQAAFQLGFLCAAYFVGSVVGAEPGHRAIAGGRIAVALIVAMLVAAVQTLPALELMMRDAYGSTQARGTQASLQHTFAGLLGLITFVFPALTGSTETFDLLKLAKATRGDFTGYIGIVPFALFLASFWRWSERSMRIFRLIIVAVVVILFFTPFVKYVYHRFFIVAVFAMAVLAADGADAVLQAPAAEAQRAGRWLVRVAGLAVVVGAGVLAAQWVISLEHDKLLAVAQKYLSEKSHNPAFGFRKDWFDQRVVDFFNHYRLANPAFCVPIVCAVVAAIVWRLRQLGRLSKRWLSGVLVVTTVVDILVLGRMLVPQINLRSRPLRPATPTLQPIVDDKDLFRVHRLGPNASYLYRANWLLAYGVDDLAGNFSLAPETAERLFVAATATGQFNAVADLLNLKYLILEDGVPVPSENFEVVAQQPGVRTYRNKSCLPRLRFVSQWEVLPSRAEILARMKQPNYEPSRMAFLEESPAVTPGLVAVAAKVRLLHYDCNRVTGVITATHPGLLVLADTWYPGWKVTVDRQPARLYRADYVLRAVAVPAGKHQVEFYFASTTIRIGALLSLGTVALVLAWFTRQYLILSSQRPPR